MPHLADVKPFGQYVMTDIDRVGGVPVVMKALLDAGLLHGDCLTVTGKTMAENLADIAPPDVDGKVVRALRGADPQDRGPDGPQGSLAPEGAVVKSAGFDASVFEGTARVFDGERAAMDAVEAGSLRSGDVVVIRYEGPKGGPGMREMLAVTGAIKGAASARTSCCSRTGGSPAARQDCASATSPPRQSTGARSPSSRTATGSPSTSPRDAWTCTWTRPSWRGAARRASRPGAEVHPRGAREVPPARRQRLGGAVCG